MNAHVSLLVLLTGLLMAVWNGDRNAAHVADQQQQLQASPEVHRALVLAAIQRAQTDQNPGSPGTMIARQSQRPQSPLNGHSADSPRVSAAPSVQDARTTALRAVADATPVDAEQCIPIPPEIASGRYQAVSQNGRTMQITIGETGFEATVDRKVQDCYVSQSGNGVRWYLVRIHSATAQQ